jgi:CheY-like chemotaxis protein
MPTVLIVEDEFAVADLLEMALNDEGYEVQHAADGRQGLERLADGPRPDLVITDYMMPILNGPGLIKALRSQPAYGDVPYIVMSSIPEAQVRDHVDGYAAFLRKPFRVSAMLDVVRRVIGPADEAPTS